MDGSLLRRAAAAAACVLCAALGAFAQESAPSADEIVRRVNARNDGAAVSRTLLMRLIDRGGAERTRELRSFRKDFPDSRRSVLFFTSPKSVKDTAFLTWDYAEPGHEDDLWLYLPALRRSRRIATSDRGASFVGTDFSYEDLKKETRIDVADYRFATGGAGRADGQPCWVLEATPVDERTARQLGYGRVRACVDASIWLAREIEYWDPGGRPLKTVRLLDVRQVDGIWTAHRVEAHNHETGHATVFEFSDVDYHTPVSDDLFTERALRDGLR
jgi:uncharacterized protein